MIYVEATTHMPKLVQAKPTNRSSFGMCSLSCLVNLSDPSLLSKSRIQTSWLSTTSKKKKPNLPTKSINPNLPRLCWLEHILQQQGTTRGRSRLRCRWHLCRGGRRSRCGLRVVRGRSQAHHGWDARATVGLEGQLPKATFRLIERRSFYSFCKIVSVYIYIYCR